MLMEKKTVNVNHRKGNLNGEKNDDIDVYGINKRKSIRK